MSDEITISRDEYNRLVADATYWHRRCLELETRRVAEQVGLRYQLNAISSLAGDLVKHTSPPSLEVHLGKYR